MNLALFDFDHTVTTCDTYSRFVRGIATPEQIARARWTVGPWVAGYRLGVVSAKGIRARVTRLAFDGRSAEEIAAAGTHYAQQVLPGLLRPEMMARIDWHRQQGDAVVLVSGSLDTYLAPWCRLHGLNLICNRLESRNDRLTGRYFDGDCGPRKAAMLRKRYDVAAYPRIYAYGDSREDRPMLALAHERWYRGKRIA